MVAQAIVSDTVSDVQTALLNQSDPALHADRNCGSRSGSDEAPSWCHGDMKDEKACSEESCEYVTSAVGVDEIYTQISQETVGKSENPYFFYRFS